MPDGSRTRVLLTLVLSGALLAATAGQVARVAAQAASGREAAPWADPLRRVDTALVRREYRVALAAAQDAHDVSLLARRWEGLVATGHAYRRLGEATDLRRSFDAKARELYMAALTLARADRSVDGVLQVADAFLALGDPEVARQCVKIADRLAGQDRDAQAQVRRLADRVPDAGSPSPASSR